MGHGHLGHAAGPEMVDAGLDGTVQAPARLPHDQRPSRPGPVGHLGVVAHHGDRERVRRRRPPGRPWPGPARRRSDVLRARWSRRLAWSNALTGMSTARGPICNGCPGSDDRWRTAATATVYAARSRPSPRERAATVGCARAGRGTGQLRGTHPGPGPGAVAPARPRLHRRGDRPGGGRRRGRPVGGRPDAGARRSPPDPARGGGDHRHPDRRGPTVLAGPRLPRRRGRRPRLHRDGHRGGPAVPVHGGHGPGRRRLGGADGPGHRLVDGPDRRGGDVTGVHPHPHVVGRQHHRRRPVRPSGRGRRSRPWAGSSSTSGVGISRRPPDGPCCCGPATRTEGISPVMAVGFADMVGFTAAEPAPGRRGAGRRGVPVRGAGPRHRGGARAGGWSR